jgi:hypothetical protein
MDLLTVLAFLLLSTNGRASLAGIITVIVIACYACWYLFRAVRYLYRKIRGVALKIGGKRVDADHRETGAEGMEEQMQRVIFPGGEEEIAEEAGRLRSLLKRYYPPSLLRSVLVSASGFFARSEDKSEGKLLQHIREKSNHQFSKPDAKALHDFIYSRALRLAMGMTKRELASFNDIRDLTGCDADKVPGGKGPFGLSADNPIPVKGIISNDYYLGRLRTWKGERITWERKGSITAALGGKPVDVYRIFDLEGGEMTQFYISPYHRRVSNKAPEGFRLLTKADVLPPSYSAPRNGSSG